jgi:hypothetical protein
MNNLPNSVITQTGIACHRTWYDIFETTEFGTRHRKFILKPRCIGKHNIPAKATGKSVYGGRALPRLPIFGYACDENLSVSQQ